MLAGLFLEIACLIQKILIYYKICKNYILHIIGTNEIKHIFKQ